MAYKPSNANGQATMANSEPVVIASDQSAIPITDNSGSLTVDNAGLTALNGAISGTEVQVDVLTMPTTTVTATNLDVRDLVFATDKVDASGSTLGSNSGVDIGDVTINNASGASAVNIQDGGNSITVDGTVAVSGSVTVQDGGGSLTVDNNGTFAVQAAAAGDVAHDTADSGNPQKIGFKAYELDGTAPQTPVAEADRVNGIGDLIGRQYVATEHPRFWHASVDYASAQTNASIKTAPGAGLALYITDIMISNGATAGNVTLLDGSGGTVLFEIYPAVNGGVALNLKNPIKLTDNTALVITSTTVTTHSVFVSGFID